MSGYAVLVAKLRNELDNVVVVIADNPLCYARFIYRDALISKI